MVPGSQTPGDVPATRSGGKILKLRKTAVRKTPYDRPTQPQPPLPQPENPNWLSGLVSPAKFVAGGATKILSSFWNPKSWATPASSSEDTDSDSEDGSGDDENVSDEQQQDNLYQKSETLHLIEQLLMLEQFSREEGNRLIEIINSRVVDYSMREGVDAGAGPSMIRSSTNDETPDIRSQAIMEAKRWVEENKVKSGLKADLGNGTYAIKSVTTPQVTEGEAGSPIDVAKSYMKARPPWASPINLENSPTSSPLAADLFKERTPYSSGGRTFFSSSKRDYLSAGSWNIQEEIRRVRTKATEDMLSSHRSIKFASSTLKLDNPIHSLANDKSINAVGRDELINLGTPKSVEETVNLSGDESTPGLSDIRTSQDVLPVETLPSNPIMPVLEQYEGMNPDKRQNTRPSHEVNSLEMEKDHKQPDERDLDQENNSMANDIDQADKNGYSVTELPDIINNFQCSSNTNEDSLATKIDGTTENRAVTRASKNTRRGKGRGK